MKCKGVLLEDGHCLEGGDIFCSALACVLIYRKDTSVAEFDKKETPNLVQKFGYLILNSDNCNVFQNNSTSLICVSDKGVFNNWRFMGNIASTFEVLKEAQSELEREAV